MYKQPCKHAYVMQRIAVVRSTHGPTKSIASFQVNNSGMQCNAFRWSVSADHLDVSTPSTGRRRMKTNAETVSDGRSQVSTADDDQVAAAKAVIALHVSGCRIVAGRVPNRRGRRRCVGVDGGETLATVEDLASVPVDTVSRAAGEADNVGSVSSVNAVVRTFRCRKGKRVPRRPWRSFFRRRLSL